MDKNGKKTCTSLTYGFWLMLLFFALMVIFSASKAQWLQWPSLIAGVLFVVSVFFVFITSILTVAPEGKGMAYVALAVAILFILYILLSTTLGISSASGSMLG